MYIFIYMYIYIHIGREKQRETNKYAVIRDGSVDMYSCN